MTETIDLHSPFLNEHNTILVSYQNAFLLHLLLQFVCNILLVDNINYRQDSYKKQQQQHWLASKEVCGDTYSNSSKSIHKMM